MVNFILVDIQVLYLQSYLKTKAFYAAANACMQVTRIDFLSVQMFCTFEHASMITAGIYPAAQRFYSLHLHLLRSKIGYYAFWVVWIYMAIRVAHSDGRCAHLFSKHSWSKWIETHQ